MSKPTKLSPHRIFDLLSEREPRTAEESQALVDKGLIQVAGGGFTLTKEGKDWRWSYLQRAGRTMMWYHPQQEFAAMSIIGQAAGILQRFDDLEGSLIEDDDTYLDKQTHAKAQETDDGGITKRQHIIPRAHLDRFASDVSKMNGKTERVVWVHRRRYGDIRRLNPGSSAFCRLRLWTHTAEHHWLRWAEEAFLDEVEAPVSLVRSNDGQKKVTDYWAMCRARTEVAHKRIRPIRLNSVTRVPYTQAEKDQLAKADRVFISDVGDDTQAIAAFLVRGRMDMHIRTANEKGVRWGIVRAAGEEEFVLPDLFPFFIVPIDPRAAFVGFYGEHAYHEEVDVEGLERLNFDLAASAKDFTVARTQDLVRRIQANRGEQ